MGPEHVPAAEEGADPEDVDVGVVLPVVELAGAVVVTAPGRHCE